jgi:hypothetical protein
MRTGVLPLAQARTMRKLLRGAEATYANVEPAIREAILDAEVKRAQGGGVPGAFEAAYERLSPAARTILVHYNMVLVRWLDSGGFTASVQETAPWLPDSWQDDLTLDPDTLVVCLDRPEPARPPAELAWPPARSELPQVLVDTLVATVAWGEAWLFALRTDGKFSGTFKARRLVDLSPDRDATRLVSCAEGAHEVAFRRLAGVAEALRRGMFSFDTEPGPIRVFKR